MYVFILGSNAGILEKKMETTGIIGVMLGIYRKENGNYCLIGYILGLDVGSWEMHSTDDSCRTLLGLLETIQGFLGAMSRSPLFYTSPR